MAANVTASTRDINELNPLVQVMLNAALDKIKAKKINPLVVETYRPKEQNRESRNKHKQLWSINF